MAIEQIGQINMKILLFLLIPIFVFGQAPFRVQPFAAADTIGSITSQDSIQALFGGGADWQLLTESLHDTAYVTANDKSSELELVFDLANESFWTYASKIRFRIVAFGTDTITSSWVHLPTSANGAATLHIKPDTVGTNTFYGNSYIEGN